MLPLYRRFGADFVKFLDGEFAIVVVDYAKREMLLSTDVFGTKPLFYSRQRGALGCSSYKSGLKRSAASQSRMRDGEEWSADIDLEQLEPNTWIILSLDEFESAETQGHMVHKIVNRGSLREFDLRQYKNKVDDFIAAFER